jgi:hypothetical protein
MLDAIGKLLPSSVVRSVGTRLAKHMVTRASAEAAKPLFVELFTKRMNAASRALLAGRLEALAAHLRAGECAKAAEVGSEIIDSVEL